MLIFYWFLYYFVEIDVFDVDSRPRAILDPKMWKNGSNFGVKTDPRRKNRGPKRGRKFDGFLDGFLIEKRGPGGAEGRGVGGRAGAPGGTLRELVIDFDRL